MVFVYFSFFLGSEFVLKSEFVLGKRFNRRLFVGMTGRNNDESESASTGGSFVDMTNRNEDGAEISDSAPSFVTVCCRIRFFLNSSLFSKVSLSWKAPQPAAIRGNGGSK